jgi:hypothetical protein
MDFVYRRNKRPCTSFYGAKLRIYCQFIGDSVMKTRTTIFISALLALTSCGSAAQYAIDSSDQRFQDGIYYTPKTSNGEAVVASSDMEETDYLVAKTKNSPIFMKSGEKVDTLFIPSDKVAKIEMTDVTSSLGGGASSAGAMAGTAEGGSVSSASGPRISNIDEEFNMGSADISAAGDGGGRRLGGKICTSEVIDCSNL